MSVAIISGSAGLVGSESVRFFANKGLDIVGIDNDMRSQFFGLDASTDRIRRELQNQINSYSHHNIDIRNNHEVFRIFARYGNATSLVIHTAAQPSHDWAAQDPFTDFGVNGNGTMVMLEAARRYCPNAVFIFTSTNKVYGDLPNHLPLVEQKTRWEIEPSHDYANGIPECMSIDQSLHSLFGVSKVAADLLVQEYGRYFGMKTVCFRGGCLTGPNHSGTQLHGFLAYLMKCVVTGTKYKVLGYKGKQVRDNIHSSDLVRAFYEVFKKPVSGEVFNMGGSRFSNCSMLEAISICEEIASNTLNWEYIEMNRKGDHIWYISDVTKFKSQFPTWNLKYDVESILREIHDINRTNWSRAKKASA